VANPLKRELLNPTMLASFQLGADGSLTLYMQGDSVIAGVSVWYSIAVPTI